MGGLRRAFVLSVVAAIPFAGTAEAGSPPGLNATAQEQIGALQQIKTSLSPAERKLDSRLVVELRQRANVRATAALPRLTTGVAVARGRTDVDIRTSADLSARLRALGAEIRDVSVRERSIRATVPVGALKQIAGWKDVRRVDLAIGRTLGTVTKPSPESKVARAKRIETRLKAALAAPRAAASQGSVVSEGDATHAADAARTETSVTGAGVKVCVMSDGVDSLDVSQTTGDLPPDVDVLPGQAGDGDEGTAMLEIVHDIAPGADLGFATINPSQEAFADNIRALRARAGCDIIVDDVVYYAESPFQDGVPARAVNQVTSDGALYFSSAGNEGNVLDGTSGNYEGMFKSSGREIGKVRGFAHDFDPGTGIQELDPLSDFSFGVPLSLFWADPLGAAADDYDLYVLDPAGNVIAYAQDIQDGDDDPFEILLTPLAVDMRVAVVKFRGEARQLQVSAWDGRFMDSDDGLTGYFTPGMTRGHNSARLAFGVGAAPAAVPWDGVLEPGEPDNPAGPFPDPFSRFQRPERYTSDGPRRMFFQPNGAPVGAGGVVRPKPDVTAADGVMTSVETPGDPFQPFFGTSAAAPHAAAIAALALSGNPGMTASEVRAAFNATALDLSPTGFDNRTGAGLLRADRVLDYTGATAQPLVRPGATTMAISSGDGDEFLEPGERALLLVRVRNTGDATATGVSVRVVSDDPHATVSPRAKSYGDLAMGAAKGMQYRLALDDDYQPGRPVHLDITISFAGGLSPTTTEVTVPSGEPSDEVTDFAYTGPPVAIPDDSTIGATIPIPVSGFGYASGLTVSIDGTTCDTAETVGIDHTFVGDLTGVLSAPNGARAALFERDGGSGENMCKAVFDDAAGTPIADAFSDDAPFTGSWQPHDPLAPLIEDSVDGRWQLKVTDGAQADTGSLRAASLHFRGFAGGD